MILTAFFIDFLKRKHNVIVDVPPEAVPQPLIWSQSVSIQLHTNRHFNP